MSTEKEEEKKIEQQTHYDDNATTVEGGIQELKQPVQKSEAEKKLQRRINFIFLPLVIWILMVQARHFMYISV